MKIRLVFLVVAMFVACIAHSAAAQPSERIIKRLPVEKSSPIEITDVKVEGQSVSFDKAFMAGDDWLRGLVISIRNKSDKVILFASLRLQFPRPAGSEERISVYNLYWGNWGLQIQPRKPGEQLVVMKPGDSDEIKLSAQQFTDLRDFLSMTHYPFSIERVDLSIAPIIFDDDSMWYAGDISRRAPNDPATWINSRYSNSKP
jgi:hypothetical protein